MFLNLKTCITSRTVGIFYCPKLNFMVTMAPLLSPGLISHNYVFELESSITQNLNYFVHKFEIKMGIKALVDYSLIKELCDNKIKRSKHNFTGKVRQKSEADEAKTDEKVNKIKRLLLPNKKEREKIIKKAKPSIKITPKKSYSSSSQEYISNSSDDSISESPEVFDNPGNSEQSCSSDSRSSSGTSELEE